MQKDLEIIRNIAQAASNITYDGATDEKYEPHNIGLKRDEGHLVLDSRTIDGFKVKMTGNQLVITYSIEQKLSDVYAQKLQQEMDAIIDKCASYLKGEYRKISGKNLRLSPVGDVDVMVTYISRVRTCVYAYRVYKIASLKDTDQIKVPSEDRLNDAFKKFLSMGRDDAPNPMNITRKET